MSSEPSSSTQHSDPSSRPSDTQEDDPPSASDIVTYRDLSGSDILHEIENLQDYDIHYAADKNIISQCEFVFDKHSRGDILIPKHSKETLKEYLLTGIFRIDARNFFMTADGKWNANNPLGTRIDQVKPSCHLLPVDRNPEFSYSLDDFPTILSNLRAIESLANPQKTKDKISVIVEEPGLSPSIKLIHHLFVVCLIYFPINIVFSNNLYERIIKRIPKKPSQTTPVCLPVLSYLQLSH
jgi:hypothetical protein